MKQNIDDELKELKQKLRTDLKPKDFFIGEMEYSSAVAQNWYSLNGKPYITVSAKGKANGLSTIMNDGADFGVDTTGTVTNGIKEAINYCLTHGGPAEIRLMGTTSGNSTFGYNSNDTFDFTPLANFTFTISAVGNSIGAYINFSSGAGITINNTSGMSLVFKGIGLEDENGANGITINGPSNVVGLTVFLDHVVFGGLGSSITTAVLNINHSLVFGTALIFSVSTAPSAILTDCISEFDIIENTGFIQFSGGRTTIGEFDVEFNTSTTMPIFANMTVSINTLYTFAPIFFSGANGTIAIDKLIIDGIGGSNVGIPAWLCGNGSSPTPSVENLYVGTIVVAITVSALNTFPLFLTSGTYELNVINSFYVQNLDNYTGNMQTTIPPKSVSISPNPPTSGGLYQNLNPYDIIIQIPITYNPTSTAAATLQVSLTPTTTQNLQTMESEPAALTVGRIKTYTLKVPKYWYYTFVATNATLGTAQVYAA